MESKKLGHRCFVGIDRERSLRAVELAQKSLGKNRSVRSHSKYHQQDFRGMNNKKMELIHQIQEKLSMPKDVKLNSQTISNSGETLGNRVLRLEKMMSQIRNERLLTEQPKTVFVRQQFPQSNHYQQSHTGKTSIIRSKSNLQIILKEINNVRQEVKNIHRANQKVLVQSYNHNPRKISQKVHSYGYEQFKRQKESEMFSRFPSANGNQNEQLRDSPSFSKPNLHKKDSLIHELHRMMPSIEPEQSSSFGGDFNKNQEENMHLDIGTNPQLNYQSQVLYAWKLGEKSRKQIESETPKIQVSGPDYIKNK